jgi:hypothetical protein
MEDSKITFADIQRANDSLIGTDIRGKNYVEVNQRIKAFRMVYPTGTIQTKLVSNENGVCVFRAYIYDGDRLLATGTAYEKENSTFINKTSYIENCETSAIGRALGIAGFGIDTSVASAEEVQNAMANQKKEQDEILDLMQELSNLLDETNTDRDKFYKHYKVTTNGEMTLEQLREATTILKGRLK